MRAVSFVVASVLLLGPLAASAQEPPARWQRRSGPTVAPVTVFHSTQSANLPTAETLRRGELLFEISHRFFPAISQGSDALWGLDGPVVNRLGLAYAVSDRAMIGVLRSNLFDNLELDAKVRVFEAGRDGVPVMVALMGGVAFNTGLPEGEVYDGNETQAYGQLILNARVGERLAIGAVPTLLYNPRIADTDKGSELMLGLNAQVYLSAMASLFGEWVVSPASADFPDEATGLADAATIGLELETGGHFFKLLVTNSTRLNPTQLLQGTPYPFEPNEWRLGFNVTRLLSLGG